MTQYIQTATNNFETADLGCAAAIFAKGYSLSHLDRSDTRKVRFVFAPHPELETSIQDYWSNKLTLPAQEYFNALRSLKNQIYNQ